MSQPRPCRRALAVLALAIFAALPAASWAQTFRPVATIDPATYGQLANDPILSTNGTSVFLTGTYFGVVNGNNGYYWTLGQFTPGAGVQRLAIFPFGFFQPPLGPFTFIGPDLWYVTNPSPPNGGTYPVIIARWTPGSPYPQQFPIPANCGVYGGSGLLAAIGTDLCFDTVSGAQFNRGAICKLNTITGQFSTVAPFTSVVPQGVQNLTAVGPYLVWSGPAGPLTTCDTRNGVMWSNGWAPALGSSPLPDRFAMTTVGSSVEIVTGTGTANCAPACQQVQQRHISWDPATQVASVLRGPSTGLDSALSRVWYPSSGEPVFVPGFNQGGLCALYHWSTGAAPSPFTSVGGGTDVRFAVALPNSLVCVNGTVLWEWTLGPDPATVATLGSGCTTVGGSPVLSFTPPVIGAAMTAAVVNAPPGWVGYLYLSGAGAAPIPTPAGCDVWLDLGTVGPLAVVYTTVAGTWSYTAAVSGYASLVGLHFRLQALILSQTGDYGLTNAVEAVTGY